MEKWDEMGKEDRAGRGEDREVPSRRRSIKDFNQTPVARERRLATRKVLA